jgi:hypothetical protein
VDPELNNKFSKQLKERKSIDNTYQKYFKVSDYQRPNISSTKVLRPKLTPKTKGHTLNKEIEEYIRNKDKEAETK